MELTDLVVIDISPEMVEVARAEQAFLDSKNQGAKTRNLFSDKNIVGSLAHQCVELAFGYEGLAFTSYRTQRFIQGDSRDLDYEDDHIDVKGTRSAFNTQYYYNKGFLVFADLFESNRLEDITHFCFVEIEPDYSRGRIYGVIGVNEFLDKAYTQKLTYENKGIRAYQLKPFAKYVWRV